MKRLSKIDESAWGEMRKRSSGEVQRKEDIINSNVKDMKPVDLGLSVLWADIDLVIDDEYEFTIDEIKDYAPDGWRRPTRKEADELLTDAQWSNNWDSICISHDKDKDRLYFISENKLKFEYWELDPDDKLAECWGTFDFKKDGSFYLHSAYSISDFDEKHRVRFVREK